jgi:hypothetical protein
MVTFRKAIRHYAVKVGLEFAKGIRTDKTRLLLGVQLRAACGTFMLTR